jgi:hypothetical protein
MQGEEELCKIEIVALKPENIVVRGRIILKLI